MGAKKVLVDFYNLPTRGVPPPHIPLDPHALFKFFDKCAQGKVSEENFTKWFNSRDAFDFYIDWVNTHNIVMSYVAWQGIAEEDWKWLVNNLRDVATMPTIQNDNQKDFINLGNGAIIQHPQSVHDLKIVDEIYFPLYCELLDLLMGNLKLQRCEANDCGRLFYYRSSKRFCSSRCKDRVKMQIRRKKEKND